MGDHSRQQSTSVAGRGYGYRYRVAGNDSLDERSTHLGVGQAGRLQSLLQPRYPRPTGLPYYEPLITLAAAAAVTERVRLMPTVLIAPLRREGVLAKQAATIDALSGGRLTLGLGVGAREDDFQFAPASFHDRGRRFEEQLELMKRVWSGQPVSEEVGAVGPLPAQAGVLSC